MISLSVREGIQSGLLNEFGAAFATREEALLHAEWARTNLGPWVVEPQFVQGIPEHGLQYGWWAVK